MFLTKESHVHGKTPKSQFTLHAVKIQWERSPVQIGGPVFGHVDSNNLIRARARSFRGTPDPAGGLLLDGAQG